MEKKSEVYVWAEFYWSQSTSLFMQCYVMRKIEFHD